MSNRLSNEISPYLLQHQHNPVNWWAWGNEAFAMAKQDNKPVLVSIGYAACHWCHVMAHESFENHDIAQFLNQHFICIKVDREERPDIDAIYMQAIQLMQISGGWPLNVFVTPEGKPFFGGTYFPPEPQYGRPSFKQLLEFVLQAWTQERDKVDEYTQSMQEALQEMAKTRTGSLPLLDELDEVCLRLLNHVDWQQGGMQGAPKFPQTPLWLTLYDVAWRRKHQRLWQAIELTVKHMCQGGIYDHLAGGFARYATDQNWLIPHFEKMLYDNAQLLELLNYLWLHTRQGLYQERLIETVDWLLREMLTEDGAFASALDADSEGQEGKFYTWHSHEIDKILQSDAEFFKKIYGVTEIGNWEHSNILHQVDECLIEADLSRLKVLKQKLFLVRQQRISPARDDKVLTDWNALTLASIVRVAMSLEQTAWLEKAIAIYQTLKQCVSDDHRLFHVYRQGRAKGRGTLDDYAAMIQAALTLYQATGELAYLSEAKTWAGTVEVDFYAQDGAYYSASNSKDLIVRLKVGQDQAIVSSNGLMAINFVQLYYLSGDECYVRRYQHIVRAFANELTAEAPFYGTLLRAVSLMQNAKLVIIVGEHKQAMIQGAWQSANPQILVMPVNGEALLAGHPAYGKIATDGLATAYICQHQTCMHPINDPVELTKILKDP